MLPHTESATGFSRRKEEWLNLVGKREWQRPLSTWGMSGMEPSLSYSLEGIFYLYVEGWRESKRAGRRSKKRKGKGGRRDWKAANIRHWRHWKHQALKTSSTENTERQKHHTRIFSLPVSLSLPEERGGTQARENFDKPTLSPSGEATQLLL